MNMIFFLLPVAVCLWLLYEWYEHNAVQYTTTVVESDKLNEEIKICFISDLHNNKKKYSSIVERIKKSGSDVILIAGDMVDKHKETNDKALDMLYALKNAAPVFYSAGNHESSMAEKKPEAWNAYLEALPRDVCYLDNDVCRLAKDKDIFISGLTLPKSFYQKGDLYENRAELPELPYREPGYHIMLAHNPEYVHFYDKYDADLILSGHLHGGLMRLPLIGGLVSPRLRFPGRDAGLIPLDDGKYLFISRGLGSHTIPLRFFNRVEINFIVLKGTKETE